MGGSPEFTKKLFSINSGEKRNEIITNLIRNWDVLFKKNHQLCKMEINCQYCLVRSIVLRLKSYGGKGPKSLNPIEMELCLKSLEENTTFEILTENLLKLMCEKEDSVIKNISNQDCSQCQSKEYIKILNS